MIIFSYSPNRETEQVRFPFNVLQIQIRPPRWSPIQALLVAFPNVTGLLGGL